MGGVHYTACSGQHDAPAEDVCEAVGVVGTRYGLQPAEQHLSSIFADRKADLA